MTEIIDITLTDFLKIAFSIIILIYTFLKIINAFPKQKDEVLKDLDILTKMKENNIDFKDLESNISEKVKLIYDKPSLEKDTSQIIVESIFFLIMLFMYLYFTLTSKNPDFFAFPNFYIVLYLLISLIISLSYRKTD